MIFYATYIDDNFVGFIDTVEQQAFLLEQNPDTKFYEFEWETGHNPPPMSHNVELIGDVIKVRENQ